MTRPDASSIEKSPTWWVSLVKNLRLSWRLFRDPLVPILPKLIPLGAVLYILLPTDLVPDFFLGLGQMDDLGVFLLSLRAFVNLCPAGIVQRHLAEMASVKGSYRVVTEEPTAGTDAAGYLDVESRVLPSGSFPAPQDSVEKNTSGTL
jgi:uncharacterized membrane protein YkvA (DUF1232 family)